MCDSSYVCKNEYAIRLMYKEICGSYHYMAHDRHAHTHVLAVSACAHMIPANFREHKIYHRCGCTARTHTCLYVCRHSGQP
jgi:hypothetical protein